MTTGKKSYRYIPFGRTNTVLFIACVCVIVLRACSMENPHILLTGIESSLFDSFYSLCISGVLVLIFALWLITRLSAVSFVYRLSRLEIGTILFIIAAVVSSFFASDKRAAVTDSITMIAPMLMAIVLVQILDSSVKKKILLAAIIAISIASAYQCAEQFFSSNRIMIAEYKNDPNAQLEKLGIEPGSFQQMLYEHQLKSKDVRGFFITGNSSGAFFCLALFSGIALFFNRFREIKKTKHFKDAVLAVSIFLIIIAALLMTHSKGALSSVAAGLAVLGFWMSAGSFLRKYRWYLLTAAFVSIIASTVLLISWGRDHGSLPGGNSMLVRWQYWAGAAEIIKRHWLSGIGPANFYNYYTHYKTPAAIETVRDPHCFVLSLWSQYGLIGLTGFLAAVFSPLAAVMFAKKRQAPHNLRQEDLPAAAKFCGIAAILTLLLIRPILVKINADGPVDAVVYIIAISYIAPVFFFGTVLWLWARDCKDSAAAIYPAALVIGIMAFLLHNLVDFAIFEPGILTIFWAIIACIGADETAKTNLIHIPKPLKRIITLVVLAGVWFFIKYAVLPTAAEAADMQTAQSLIKTGRLAPALDAMDRAIESDPLSSRSAMLKADICIGTFLANTGEKQKQLLIDGKKALIIAISRNNADFKGYQKLAKVYNILADLNTRKKAEHLAKARDAADEAILRYPGSSELRLQAGKIAEKSGRTDDALEYYKKCVEFENAYAAEFKKMYPGQPVFNRLGNIKYKFALERIKALSDK